MTDNELLLQLSELMDKKLQSLKEDIKDIKIALENDMLPRLQNIEACYTGTYSRYKSGIAQMLQN